MWGDPSRLHDLAEAFAVAASVNSNCAFVRPGVMMWSAVRVLPGPPRSPMRTDVSRSLTNSPQFAGISAGLNAGRAVSVAGRGRDIVDFGCRSLGSANPFLAPAGVAHEDRQDQIDKPSIAYWRDHSAGASRRRVTLMPRGSRPSTAAFTRSGARNASEIVILTCRMLHLSRAAICSTLVTVPATISSSQRRPRAIDATSVARVSARMGRRS